MTQQKTRPLWLANIQKSCSRLACPKWLALFSIFSLFASAPAVWAQQPPSAGSQLQQIPPAPGLPPKAPDILIEQDKQAPLPLSNQTGVRVDTLRITGAKAFTEATLLEASGFKPQGVMTLTDLRGLADRVSAYYQARGYFVAQAYLPAQDIKDGLVTLAVLEGRYGAVTIRNETRLKDSVAIGLMEPAPNDAVTIAPLERSLLLLNELPGVQVRSTLTPGASVGSSDLVLDVVPGPLVSGSVDGDNHGNRYTGRGRIGGSLNLNNPLGYGDVASLRLLTSGEGLNYARAAYQVQVGRAKVGVAYANLDYRLGKEFASLQAHGTAGIASVYGNYPLLRSRQSNLSLQLAFDTKSLHDRADATNTSQKKKVQVLMLSLQGDHRDSLGGPAINTYSVTGTAGNVDLQNPAAQVADASSARTQGSYGKLGFNLARLQSAGASTQFHAAVSGQLASKNLDISEKMPLGGANAVRAYPEGESYGDRGFVLTLEARYTLPVANTVAGQVQLVGFIDSGAVTFSRNPWVAGANTRKLSGAGVGLNWSVGNAFFAKAFYAHKVGSEPATSAPDASGRFWVQGVKYF
ncbi:MAG: peptide transporter [Burkholderiales bacterium]|nr:MAG: peptide transporter [Burkholderiales bacterium]